MAENTWPGGVRRALDQDAHRSWNAKNYPGTLQICTLCDEPTGQCEEDALYLGDEEETGPLCPECWDKLAVKEDG